MDGGSSLYIIYLETLNLLGIERAQVQPALVASTASC